jgi:glycosyltransferase involved in cell wall biosynthesis
MSDPRVSVIIPAYNQARYLKQSLDSALMQEGVSLEVIVIDDGSQDETPQLLKEYEGRISAIHQKNQGVAQARNSGLEIAQGEFIAFLDADDHWLPGHLRNALEVLSHEPDVGLVYSDARVIDEAGRFEKFRNSPRTASLASLVLGNFITTSSVVLRRECLEQCGTFDPAFRYASEDWDLWMRIAASYQLRHTGTALVEYRRHSQSAIQKLGFKIRDNSLLALEKAFSRDPDIPQNLKLKAEAAVYLESAVRCLASLEPVKARGEIGKALSLYRWLPRAGLLLFLSFPGKPGLALLLRFLRIWRMRRYARPERSERSAGDAQ